MKFQERAFGILNPPPEPAEPQSGRLLVELNGECHFEPSAKRKTLRSVLKRCHPEGNPEAHAGVSYLVASPTKALEQTEIKPREPVSVLRLEGRARWRCKARPCLTTAPGGLVSSPLGGTRRPGQAVG